MYNLVKGTRVAVTQGSRSICAMKVTKKVINVTPGGEGKLLVKVESGSIEMNSSGPVNSANIKPGDEIEVIVSKQNNGKLSKGGAVSGQFVKVASRASVSVPASACAESAAEPRRTDY